MGFNKDAINDIIPYAIIKGERVCNITNSIQMALVYFFSYKCIIIVFTHTHSTFTQKLSKIY